MVNMGGDLSAAMEAIADFYDELPTLQCGEGGCNACTIAFQSACAPMVPAKGGEKGEEWKEDWEEGPTKPDLAPAFLTGYDDDYILDPELGGESE